MEPKVFSMDLAGRTLTFERDKFKTQAQGSLVVSLGDTVILAAAGVTEQSREGFDFFPLTVDYEEFFFAAGKIKGSRFVKRGGRPSDDEILSSRLIDRPIRPMFPKGATNEVQLIVSVLSADLEVDPATTGITAASAALMVSGAPFNGPVAAVRVGYVKDESGEEKLVINPTYSQVESGRLNLIVAGTKDAISMVEAGAKEVSEEVILQAFELAHAEIKRICQLQEEFAAEYKAEPIEFKIAEDSEAAVKAVEGYLTQEMIDSIGGLSKKEIKKTWGAVEKGMMEKYAEEITAATLDKGELKGILQEKIEKGLRKRVIEKKIRIDGRKPADIRPVSCAVGVLPRTHGTGLFTRGETQALTVVTLGAPGDAQIVDTMDSDEHKRYFHHYNFPPYSTGEVKMLRGPSRREIGHGDLAERALIPVLPSKEDFPYTIWAHSQITSCNGSSSMASVCGSTLSLMDAGVPIKKPVSGIAMGLVMEGSDYVILSDIQGMEDFTGDMDFKATGTKDGITALQMDIKVTGLPMNIMREALQQAKEGRESIMADMLATIATPRTETSSFAPRITTIVIDVEKIREVIGKGGETIQKITAECGVNIDIDQEDGKQTALVLITAPNMESGKKAEEWVQAIIAEPEVGKVYQGKVVKLMEFGAFVEFMPGKQGLVHISELDNKRVNKVEDVVKEGDALEVKLLEIDRQGRNNLSHRATLPKPEAE